MQSQTKDEIFLVLQQYHQTLQNENMKAAPDKSHLFLTSVNFLGHIIERNIITPLKNHASTQFKNFNHLQTKQNFMNSLEC